MKENTWRKVFIAGCALVLVAAIVVVAVVLSGRRETQIPAGPESGVYYYDADNGDTYSLTLSGGDNIALQIRDELISGTYTLTEGTFELTLDSEAEITAAYADDVVTLNYDGSSMRFLRNTSYTVTFESNGGSAVAPVKVVNGRTVQKPDDPARSGYAFLGWYSDADFNSTFAFGATPVTGNTTIYARWSDKLTGIPVYQVSFDLNYSGAPAMADEETLAGKLLEVTEPIREGYTFAGWWISDFEQADKLTYLYEEDTAFTANTTLYALWEPVDSDKLATPTPRVSGDSVVWDPVEGVSTYWVQVTGPNGLTLMDQRTGATSVTVRFSTAEEGVYKISVQAIAPNDNGNSEVAERYLNNKALNRVSVFTVIEPSILLFQGVEGAENYKVSVVCGNPDHHHTLMDNGTSTYFDFSGCEMTENGILFQVTASATGYASSTSAVFCYNRVLSEIGAFNFDEANEILSWDAVTNAADYEVTVTAGDEVVSLLTGGRTEVSLKNYAADTITVSVKPVTAGYNSPEAASHTYNRVRLSAPTGLNITGTTLTWGAVEGAQSYTVLVDGREYEGLTDCSLDLSQLPLTNGVDYAISVKAVGATESVYSDALTAQYYSLSPRVTYVSGQVHWEPVIGAVNYQVRVNSGSSVSVPTGTHSTAMALSNKGINTISVRYTDNSGNTSDWVSIEVFAYEVQFDSREGTASESLYLAMGDVLNLPVSERGGYDLSGWYTVPGGASVNGTRIKDGSTLTTAGDLILYAGWSPKSYTVTYDPDSEGTVDHESDTVTFTENFQLAVPVTEDTSLSFVGWYDGVNGQGTQLTDSSGQSLAPWSNVGDLTVYPYWVSIFQFRVQQEGELAGTYSVTATSEVARVTHVVVPEFYNGEKVTIVEGYAFYQYTTIRSIDIPDTIEIIYYGEGAFEGCSRLEAINIYETGNVVNPRYSSHDGVLYYTSEVAEEGKSLVYIPEGKTGSYVIPDDVEVIASQAFSTSRLTSVTIPSSVSSIATQAFYGCTYITDIYFDYDEGDELIIEEEAFAGCTRLRSLTIPARLKEFSPAIIGDSTVFENIYVDENHETLGSVNGMLTNKAGDTIEYCPPGRRGALRIPTGIRTISAGAFSGCSLLTSLTVPNFVTTIEDNAFSGCTGLSKVTFAGGNSLGEALTIGNSVFEGCERLSNVIFEDNSNVVTLGEGTFRSCSRITSITLPATLTTLEGNPFAGCTNLVSIVVNANNPAFMSEDGVLFDKNQTRLIYYSANLRNATYTLPDSVVTVEANAFNGNINLITVIFGTSIRNIGSYAFYECANLRDVVFTDNGTSTLAEDEGLIIESYAFASCNSLDALYVGTSEEIAAETYVKGTPSFLRIIDEYAFYESRLSDIVLSEGLEEIGYNAFGYTMLNSIGLPASLKTIAEEAFFVVSSLTSATIAENSQLEYIGPYAFYSTQLVSFHVPKTVTEIADCAFSSTDLSEGFTFEEGRTESIKLGISLFAGTYLTSIVFPDLVELSYDTPYGTMETTIDGAFMLTDIQNMPANSKYSYIDGIFYETVNGVPVILDHAILADTDFEVPNTVNTIRAGAFSSLINGVLTFEAGGTEDLIVEDDAFNNSGLAEVHFPARLAQLGSGIDAPEWGIMGIGPFSYSRVGVVTFEDTEENPSRLREIPDQCFFSTPNLTSIEIPRSVKRIGDQAFTPGWDGGGIEQLTLHEGLEEIGYMAFASDSGEGPFITELHIPSTVKSIGRMAFNSAVNLSEIVFERDENGECALEILGQGAFMDAPITTISLPKTLAGSAYVTDDNTGELVPDGKLGDYLFSGCSQLTTVIFEDGCPLITSYGNGVFSGCTSYANVIFPDNLQSIGTWGEGGAIKTITILNFFTEEIFMNFVPSLSGVISFTMEPNNPYLYQDVKTVDGETVYGAVYNAEKTKLLYYPNCYTYESYTVLDSTLEIADRAFYENSYLKQIILPEGLVTIGDYAFGVGADTHTTALTSITIPSTVATIGDYAFYGAKQMQSVTFSKNASGASALTFIGSSAFRNCTALESVEIPDSVSAMGENIGWNMDRPDETASVFYNCTSLKSVTLPNNLVNLLSLTFANCTSLETVIIKENSVLLRIAEYAFLGSGLVSIDLSNAKNLTEIADYAFADNARLQEITFPSINSIQIGAYVFSGTAFTSLDLPANILTIGDYAFDGVTTLTDLELAADNVLESIGAGAFRNTGITSFDFAGAPNLISIGDYAFYQTGLTEVLLSDSVTTIGDYAFYGCASVTELDLSQAIESIGAYAFAGTGITEVTVYGNNTVIGTSAFEDCADLTSVTLEEGVRSVGNFAFSFTGITEITLPESVTTLDGNPFAGCSLEKIEILSPNADIVLDEETNFLLNADKNLLFYVTPETSGAYVVDSSLTSIMPGAFAGTAITSITLPDSFTRIEDGTFRNCTQLTSINIGKNITYIGVAAFEGCTALETVTFEQGGTQAISINERAFQNCTALETIEFPDRLRDFVVTEVEIIEIPGWGEFEQVYEYGTPGLADSAFRASGLKTITYEKNVPADISTSGYDGYSLMIGPNAFRDCVSLESVEFGAQVGSRNYDTDWEDPNPIEWSVINEYAFYNCTSLSSISLTANTLEVLNKEGEPIVVPAFSVAVTLSPYSFANCTSLEQFVVPYNLGLFDAYCFAGSGLTSFELPYYNDTSWGDSREMEYGIAEGAFSECDELVSFVSYGKFGSVSYVGPEVNAKAFKGCDKLEYVYFDDVYAVMDSAFEDCVSLKTVELNFVFKNIWSDSTNGMLIIAANAFMNCSALTTANITGDLQSISINAFAGCTSLMSFTVPNKVTSIASGAFAGWTAEQEIIVPFADANSILGGWNIGWNGNATIVYSGAAEA